MDNEARRERQKNWRKNNPEKEREYRINYLRRKYAADFLREVVENGETVREELC